MAVTEIDCRVCLEKIPKKIKVVNLFDGWSIPWDGMGDIIADDLNKFANIQVEPSDTYSTSICRTCCNKLKTACKFQVFVQKNDSWLQRTLKNNIQLNISSETAWPKPILLDNSIVGNFHSGQLQVKQEVLSDDEWNIEEKIEYNNVEIKIEPEELTYNNVNDAVTVDPSTTKADSWTDVERRHCLRDAYNKCTPQYLDEPSVKAEATSEDEARIPLDCLLCSKSFNCISGLKAHVIVHHSYKSVRRRAAAGASPPRKRRPLRHVCATCKRAFDTPTDLMVHETRHDKHACYVCNRKFDTFDTLSAHRRRCTPAAPSAPPRTPALDAHRLPQADAPKFECNQCSEHFTDPYYLTIHEALSHAASSPVAENKTTDSKNSDEDIEGNDKLLKDLNETVDESKANSDTDNNSHSHVERQEENNKIIEEDISKGSKEEVDERLLNDLNETVDDSKINIDTDNTKQGHIKPQENMEVDITLKKDDSIEDSEYSKEESVSQDMSIEDTVGELPNYLSKAYLGIDNPIQSHDEQQEDNTIEEDISKGTIKEMGNERLLEVLNETVDESKAILDTDIPSNSHVKPQENMEIITTKKEDRIEDSEHSKEESVSQDMSIEDMVEELPNYLSKAYLGIDNPIQSHDEQQEDNTIEEDISKGTIKEMGNERLLEVLNETVDESKAILDTDIPSNIHVKPQENMEIITTKKEDRIEDSECSKEESVSLNMSIKDTVGESPNDLSSQEVNIIPTNDHSTDKLLSLLDYCEEEWSNCKETERLAKNNIPVVTECPQDSITEGSYQSLNIGNSEINEDLKSIPNLDEPLAHNIESNIADAISETFVSNCNSLECQTNIPVTPTLNEKHTHIEMIQTDTLLNTITETSISSVSLEMQNAEIIVNVRCPSDNISSNQIESNQLVSQSSPTTAEVAEDLDILLNIVSKPNIM